MNIRGVAPILVVRELRRKLEVALKNHETFKPLLILLPIAPG